MSEFTFAKAFTLISELDGMTIDIGSSHDQAVTKLRAIVEHLHAAALAGPDKVLRCAFCGHEYASGTPAAKSQALTDHVLKCEKHPLAKKIREMEPIVNKAKELVKAWGREDESPALDVTTMELMDELGTLVKGGAVS